MTSLGGQDLRDTPGLNIDDRLRQAVAGFSLFRRASSAVSHPTTQGVSLRGLGSSGASRTLVLLDGIPMNDPFGGWVYWDRFAPDELERVEVSRGASTAAFGDRAMGGALAFFSREPDRLHLVSRFEGGTNGTTELSAGFSNVWNRWAAAADARAFTTSGWFVTPEPFRGAVDQRAASRFVSGGARLDWFGARARLFLRFDALAEARRNGTALQNNSTSLGTLAAHYSLDAGRNTVSAVVYHTREEFHSTFSAIAADRETERLTSRQSVPAEGTGGGVFWRRDGRFHWLVGADASRAEGWSRERIYPAGSRIGGGHIFEHGVFAQAGFDVGALRLYGGARHDFTVNGRTFFSPSGGATLGRGRWRARTSVYRGFRSPTLNELYRMFRVGNAVTRANPDLRPETMLGAEAGIDFVAEAVHASFTAYRNSLSDLITNVTLTATPDLIVRQRQNAGAAVSRGFEARLEPRWREFRADLSYLFADARFDYGARIPQVPRHQGAARIIFDRGGTLVSAGVLSSTYQFEDERNLRASLLPGFAAAQLFAARRVLPHLSAVIELENALNRQYITALTPTPMTGTPRLWRAGLRWDGRLR